MVLESAILKEKLYPKGIIILERLLGRIQSDTERSRMQPSVLPEFKGRIRISKKDLRMSCHRIQRKSVECQCFG